MTAFLVPLSIALVLTLLFGFRYRVWSKPRYMLGYFAFFFALEWAAEAWVLPPGTLGIEVAYVCFGLVAILAAAIFVTHRMERASER